MLLAKFAKIRRTRDIISVLQYSISHSVIDDIRDDLECP